MTNSQFFIQLGGVSFITALALLGLFQIPQIAPYHFFGWMSLIGFISLSIIMYFVGKQSALSDNKNNFTSSILGFTMGKMMMSVIIIFSYLKLAEPASKFFIAPFFLVYFIFTAFETYFMIKLGRMGV